MKKRAHRPTLERASATTAALPLLLLLLLQAALLLPRVAPTAAVALTARAADAPQNRAVLIPPLACQEFYETEAAPAGGGFFYHNPGDGSTASAVVTPRAAAAPRAAPRTTTESFWRASDCVDVWTSWTGTLPASSLPPYPDRQRLRERAAGMRQRGSPCLVESVVMADGVGSMTMRHLTAKIFAEEVGCDWVTPEWGTPPSLGDGSGASLYCHSAATYEERRRGFSNTTQEEAEIMVRRCSLTNWLEYFNFEMSSVEPPANSSFRIVEADTSRVEALEGALEEIEINGLDHLEWDRLKIVLRRPHAGTNYLASLGSWDGWKREAVRKVLQEFRENFHQSPRPWYDSAPECGYALSELNFALHVRMGDRRDIEFVTPEYFSLLEGFMDVVTQEVVGRGLAAPTFHVFSEALYPCPSPGNATFNEFPRWPVERDQIPSCIDAEPPADCPEKKQAGASTECRPERPGTFRVEGRPLVLHVGRDVANTLSCMIHADGLLMGCSTFGQVAGILNRDGISFFSAACDGPGSPIQGKVIPPLAVAERGRMWVPVAGSWRDPVLRAKRLFSAALDELLENKGISG